MGQTKGRFLGAGLAVLVLCVSPALGQISTDGTMGPAGPLSGPDYVIDSGLGTTVGDNLFHSFDIFNVNTGETATFTGPGGITNIIARITGMNPSFIDGLLGTDFPDDPNLWLINPFGFVFGENAELDVQGSFYATTADYLELADGGRFDASNPGMSTLSSAAPVAFGFLGAPAPIIVEGARLEVPAGETLGLIGGDISVVDGFLVARSGTIQLASVASAGTAYLTDTGVDVDEFSALGNIEISHDGERPVDIIDIPGGGQTFIPVGNLDVSGPEGGSIWIVGGNLTSNGAFINGISFGSGAVIDINMSGDILFTGETLIQIDSIGGTSGDITIEGRRIVVEGFTQIVANSQADGEGGDIFMRAEEIVMRDVATVASTTAGAGDAGDITIEATNMSMFDLSAIRADTVAGGNAGNVTVNVTENLNMTGGAAISTAALVGSAGTGGTVSVTAGELFMSGEGTLISSDSFGTGRGGDIIVQVGNLVMLDKASISSSSLGTGDAGDIDLWVTGQIDLFDASITTRAESADGGNIEIAVGDRLRLTNSEITTSVGTGGGNGGNITISDPTFIILDDSRIQANAFGGAGGNIAITADFLIGTPDSVVEASSQLGVDGEVNVNAPEADLVSSVAMPRMEFVDVEDLSAAGCQRQRRGDSSLIVDSAARSKAPSGGACADEAGR